MNTETSIAPELKVKKEPKYRYPGKKAGHYDYKWVSAYFYKWNKPHGINFRIGPASYFDNRFHISICLGWLSLYINLPIYSTIDECETPEFGFYYFMNSLVLCWNMKKKHIDMPWAPVWIRTSKLRSDGSWYVDRKGDAKKWRSANPGASLTKMWEYEKAQEGVLWSETHPYTYMLGCGEIQNRLATVKVEEREWRPKWFTWTKLFAKVNKTIDVHFDGEVGERTGSWKGGTVGCGYTILPGETPLDTLRRMEKEQKF